MTKDYLRGQGYVKAPKIEKELRFNCCKNKKIRVSENACTRNSANTDSSLAVR